MTRIVPIEFVSHDEYQRFVEVVRSKNLYYAFQNLSERTQKAVRALGTFREIWMSAIAVGQSSLEARFDSALASAAGWRQDALLYQGERHRIRIRHAERMEAIAEQFLSSA